MNALAGRQAFILHQARQLVGLAAQADDQHGGKVGVARIAGDRPAQHVRAFGVVAAGTSALVRERDHAIDVRIGLQVA